jgi:hypothetical protein
VMPPVVSEPTPSYDEPTPPHFDFDNDNGN